MELLEIAAVTRTYGDGQKAVAAVLHYDKEVKKEDIKIEDFEVEDRDITDAYVSASGLPGERVETGSFAVLELFPGDPEAGTCRMTGRGRDARTYVVTASVKVKTGGSSYTSSKTINLTVDEFREFTFEVPGTDKKLNYSLYTPKDVTPEHKLPLVLFMHDAGSCSDDVCAPLAQGNGAVIWAQEEEQKRHPCFVLAPQFPSKTAEDDFKVTWEADAVVELVRYLLTVCPVDEKRIYGTGQSMGCMMLCELMIRNPGFFAGCFLVAGQWNPDTMGAVKKENIWVLVSEKDEKAFPIMGECMERIEQAGGRVSRGSVDAKAPIEDQNAAMRRIIQEGRHIIFTWYEKDSVLPEGEDAFPGAYHVNTWVHAYGLKAIRDWLFAQSRNPIDFSCRHDVLLRNEDGTLTPMDEPYYQSKLVAQGTWQILSDGDYTYLVEGEEEALVIDSGYGCGNIRAYCQSLTDKPVRRIANTHDHFDHTANNSYFDCAYMSAETKELATIPFPSFEGIEFPRDYPIEVIGEGYTFHLGGRDLVTFKIPDHAVGSLVFLDKKEGILFCGDELGMPFGKSMSGSVEAFRNHLKRLQEHRSEIRLLCTGPGVTGADFMDRLAENMDYILSGHEGEPMMPPEQEKSEAAECSAGNGVTMAEDHEAVDANQKASCRPVIYDRRLPHAPDRHQDDPAELPFRRVMDHAGLKVMYDVRKVEDSDDNRC